jgi:pimeloyl-ACP methyl ester carboxylesterase
MDSDANVRTCRSSPDGVEIAYWAGGSGAPTLVFIHGALADHGLWANQLAEFSARHQVLAPDLAGHGRSGSGRSRWGLDEFAAHVRSVVEAAATERAVLIGSSLGGAVALEAALLIPETVMGIVGVDTFQDLRRHFPADAMRQRADMFRNDFQGMVGRMVETLFHPDTDQTVIAEVERRMRTGSAEVMAGLFESLAGYDQSATVRRLNVPVRAINGDLHPTDVSAIRKIVPTFEAAVMPHTGHFPMLERPEEFNRRLKRVLEDLLQTAGA